MQGRNSLVYYSLILTSLLFNIGHPLVLTNVCPSNSSCNCTLTNNIDLDIICSSTPLALLPTLQPNSLQTSVTQLRVLSSTSSTTGPLITFPTNICIYPNLATLDLSSNNINGLLNTSGLACLGTNLLHVDFSYNNINDIDKNLFKANRNIQTINLSHNNLTSMPIIDGDTFVNFPSKMSSMNFSYNQIINVDLWPLFVRTNGNLMTIDMSYNLIANYINTVPISVEQFTSTPDLRYFYLNNNRLTYLSDTLLEQYGACSSTDPISTAYFIVGISNLLLTNNPLKCDCNSYNLIGYINDGISDFPDINNGSALLTQATCSSPASTFGQKYIFSNFSAGDNCNNFTLPNTTDIFCSVYINDTSITITPPTYWPSTTKTVITTSTNNAYGNSGSSTGSSSSSSISLSWYIILGIVLGLVVVLAVVVLICYLCRDKIFPEKYRSKLPIHVRNDENYLNNSYVPIIRNSQVSSRKDFPLNGTKPHRASIATSACGFDDQDDDGLHSNLKSLRGHRTRTDENQPEQETQTNFPILRSKPPSGAPRSAHDRQRTDSTSTHNVSRRERKLSLSTAADIGTNTTNVVKGIPMPSVSAKIQPIPPTGNDTKPDTNTSIPLAPSKRGKLLPPVKSGIYVNSINDNLLNTSAGALVNSQRQRRRSSLWFRRQNQNMISPVPTRPQSMIAQKTVFDHDGSFDEDIPPMPTIESLTNKPSKPLRTLPLLNISIVPAWIDDDND